MDFSKDPLILEHDHACRNAGIVKGELKLNSLSNICLETLSTCASRCWPTLESGEPEQIWNELISKQTAESSASRAAAAHAAHRSEQGYGSRMPSNGALHGVSAINNNDESNKKDDVEDSDIETNKFSASEVREINKWSYHQGTLCMYPMLRLAFLRAGEIPLPKKSSHRVDLMVETPVQSPEGLPE